MYHFWYYYGFYINQKDIKPLQVDQEVPTQQTQATKVKNNTQERV